MTNTNDTIKILFFGDLVGRPGRFAVRDFLKVAKQLGSQAAKSDNSEILQISIRHCEEGVSRSALLCRQKDLMSGWQSRPTDIKSGNSEISQEQQTDKNPSTIQPFNLLTNNGLPSYLPAFLPSFIIANVENASHGFGLTEKN